MDHVLNALALARASELRQQAERHRLVAVARARRRADRLALRSAVLAERSAVLAARAARLREHVPQPARAR
ncbi:hypothetical protein [Quadrisphaera sp. DSM 44207]|uniref:hypothetical protein n=1 Tax=Quadrisphaera sp. DSM 44207 TaxID=1881057 RepID=UPI00088FC0BD|nr:hypothetical protein [Quadrisphaera sp. DSM 44207]SDQ72682.1 hypothetical protein SAMN05428996_2562 [Quadrisphaera sp. DSM 44207]